MNASILPGQTLGIFGSGQLGRMFAIAARRMGYKVHVFSPDRDTPTGQVADFETCASYDDTKSIAEFAAKVAVLTFEFENVPLEAVNTAERFAPVRPNGAVLHTTQNRIREKQFLVKNGFPVAPYAVMDGEFDLCDAAHLLGMPIIVKTADSGYDGKGQFSFEREEDIREQMPLLPPGRYVAEKKISFDCEISVVVARGCQADVAIYGPFENRHVNHILDLTTCPAQISPKLANDARTMATEIAIALGAIGVICVEFFVTSEGELIVNEIAPRPHNSGHLTIDAFTTCQFEQQVRAICGLPLGSAEQLKPASMANLLGDLWTSNDLPWERLLSNPHVKLHLYGKTNPRPGRKMGHVTALAADTAFAEREVRHARNFLIQ